MKAKMLNQTFHKGKFLSQMTKYERKYRKEETQDNMWSSVYITDLPIQTLTEDADFKTEEFINKYFADKNVKEYKIERNCMLGFWQFTVITTKEVTAFDIADETDEERKAKIFAFAEKWWEYNGSVDDKYQSCEWWIADVKEQDNGKTIIVTMECEHGVSTETFKRDNSNHWVWQSS